MARSKGLSKNNQNIIKQPQKKAQQKKSSEGETQTPKKRGKAKDSNSEFVTVKCGARKIFKGHHRDVIIDQISQMSIEATKICCLASLLTLYYINEMTNRWNHMPNRFFAPDHTFADKAIDVIERCFRMVIKTGRDEHTNDFFDAELFAHNIKKPKAAFFGNVLRYLWEQYTTNLMNNIKVHAKKRLQKFFRTFKFTENNEEQVTDAEIDTTVKFLFNAASRGNPNAFLLNELRAIWPNHPIFVRGFLDEMVKSHWFQTIPIFINIQRHIDRYNNTIDERQIVWRSKRARRRNNRITKNKKNAQNSKKKHRKDQHRGKIRNFVVVPMCSYQRKHIKIDTSVLCRILCSRNIQPPSGKIGARGQQLKMREKDFTKGHWNQYVDMGRIHRMAKHKQFEYSIVTDGVAASILYTKVSIKRSTDE